MTTAGALVRPGDHTQALTHYEHEHLDLHFQDGPVQEFGVNGTTNEEVIEVLILRIKSLNQPPFDCPENDDAIRSLEHALDALHTRTVERQRRGVEGTHTP